jgi:hypothetical protein
MSVDVQNQPSSQLNGSVWVVVERAQALISKPQAANEKYQHCSCSRSWRGMGGPVKIAPRASLDDRTDMAPASPRNPLHCILQVPKAWPRANT